MSKAKEAVISFDVSKTKLIYFYNKCITIKEGLKLGDIKISPKPLVRWLGVFLDSKLTFKQHVETKISKEKAAFYLIKRLGNTQRGLSLQALRQLYIACITTIADYGIQCWWKSTSRSQYLNNPFSTAYGLALFFAFSWNFVGTGLYGLLTAVC